MGFLSKRREVGHSGCGVSLVGVFLTLTVFVCTVVGVSLWIVISFPATLRAIRGFGGW